MSRGFALPKSGHFGRERSRNRGRAAEPDGHWGLEFRGVNSQRKPFASKVHLSLLRKKLADLGMGGGEWAPQLTPRASRIGAISEVGAYPLTHGAPAMREASMSSRKFSGDCGVWEGDSPRVAKGWVDGLYEPRQDTVLAIKGIPLRRNPIS